ncbi:MAG: FAD:protein FMN transferase [Nevskia sp.]|nr:FAD:protein FMN transferase [Nevskia sp.]
MTSPSAPAEVCRARPLLGTRVEIRAAADWPAARLHAAADAAFEAIQRVQERMSFHDPASDVSLLNREALQRPVQVDGATYSVLAAALDLSRRSGGAFDVAVGTRLQLWGYLPGGEEPPDGEADWTAIRLLPDCRVRFERPLRIDLGGIAKGYAVDCAVASLLRDGVQSALVNAGGDMRAAGPAPRRIWLRHPDAPALGAHQLTLCDQALATSATYFSRRLHGGREVSPLLDPRSGRPCLDGASVSMLAPDCLHADALTKVVLFAAPVLRDRLLADCGAQALVQQASAVAA